MNRRLTRHAVAAAAISTVFALSPAPAQEMPNEEPSAYDTLMERSDLGNVSEAAMMEFHAAKRELDRARRLTARLSEMPPGPKRDKAEKTARGAYESAIAQLTDALRTNPKLIEGYDALGRALLEIGKPQDSLQVHSAGLQRAPEDVENREGRAEALLALGQLRETALAYEALREQDGKVAGRLLAAMKRWVAAHRADPAGMSPEVVEALATLIGQWEEQAG